VLKLYGTIFLEIHDTLQSLEKLTEPIRRPAVTSSGRIGAGTALLMSNPSTMPLPAIVTEQPVAEKAPKPSLTQYIKIQLSRTELLAKILGFKRTVSRLTHINEYLDSAAARRIDLWYDEEIPREIRVLREAFRDDLVEQPVYLPDIARSAWFEHKQPFDQKVYDSFPTLHRDITDAGTCFASDNPTACVFHLMRVVEQAIRILARKLRVRGLKTDLDYEDFKRIQTELNKKLAQLRNSRRGKRREREIEFYADVADRCQYFKEMWRDNVMHSRKSYETADAAGILTRVSELMRRLAERLSEPA
jgi:hypothetical protein